MTTARTVHFRFAVIDGPEGTDAVVVPDDRDAAIKLKDTPGIEFSCTTVAGGCGGTLLIAAGKLNRPHFRHRFSHEAASCALATDPDPDRAERSYEHVWYQHALRGWLNDQGLQADIEHTFDDMGRADLYVTVDEVEQTIEVQLSPITHAARQERTKRYKRYVEHVTWLYGPGAESASASERIERGVAFMIQRHPETGTVEIGVCGHSAKTAWHPLAACRLTKDGLWTPDLEQVLAANREELRKDQERQQAADERKAAEQEAARRRAAQRRTTSLTIVPDRYTYPGTIAIWRRTHPEATTWTPEQGWGWLAALVSRV
jgi:Competence protein CoiA-like family